ncbi:MAG TPA: hypothetical protein PK710_04270 [Polyangiaceae bacterium]|nr:hypothetical protein [Polyangiaceae bacterium]HPY17598.1 hypothetical protein [Polyangiaceae bacterium]
MSTEDQVKAMSRRHMSWPPKANDASRYRGCWVALDNCRYDGSHQPVEGDVVDSDEDLAELCGRLHEASRGKCIILYCDEDLLIEPHGVRDSDPDFDERLFSQ